MSLEAENARLRREIESLRRNEHQGGGMTPPLPFANDDEAEAEYRATRHLFTRPRVRFHAGAEPVSPPPVVVSGVEAGGPAVAVPHGNNGGGSHLRTVPGAATPGAA